MNQYEHKEIAMVHAHTLIGLIFSGLGSAGFGGGTPVPFGDGVGAPTAGGFNAPLAHSLSVEPQAPTAPQGFTIPNFKYKDFPFVTTVPDDGTGKAGGWQVASVNLEFIRIVFPTALIKWYCPFKIQMPLRTEKMGIISPKLAAGMSVAVTNTVGAGMDHKLPQGIFCERFRAGVGATFKAMYPYLGSSVTK